MGKARSKEYPVLLNKHSRVKMLAYCDQHWVLGEILINKIRMIPKIIHYCWFGHGEMSDKVNACISSWKQHLPDYEFKRWDEHNFDLDCNDYVRQAYTSHKYAFVSDYVRLYALFTCGGIYLDTDVMVFKSFDPLLISHKAFAGFEGSKRLPVGTCVIGSEKEGAWVKSMIDAYSERSFLLPDGSFDQTTNVVFLTNIMVQNGLVCNGKEQDCMGMHIYPVDFFSPRRTTGEYIISSNTYSDHLGLCSWGRIRKESLMVKLLGKQISIRLIKLKRLLVG